MAGNIINGDFFNQIDQLYDHAHSQALVFPSGAGAVVLTASAAAWVGWGSTTKYEIIPSASAPAFPFDIHWAVVSSISANGDYEVGIFAGPAGSEVLIATVPITRTATASAEGISPMMTRRQPRGTRISAALRGSNAVANTVGLRLGGHAYV